MVVMPDILDPTRKIRTLLQLFRRGSKLPSDSDDTLSYPLPSPSSSQTLHCLDTSLDKTSIHTATDTLHAHAHLHVLRCVPSSAGFSVTDELKSDPSPIAIIPPLSYYSESSSPVSDTPTSPVTEIGSERTVQRTLTASSVGADSIRSYQVPRGDHVRAHVSVEDTVSAKLIRDSDYYCDPMITDDDNCCVLKVEDTLFKVHKIVLCRDNSSFSKKLWFNSYLTNGPEGLNDSNPMVLTNERVDRFRDFLWVLHTLPPDFHLLPDHSTFAGDANVLRNHAETLSLTRLLNVAESAQKYAFPSFEIWAVQQIYKSVQRGPKARGSTVSTNTSGTGTSASAESIQRSISSSSSITLLSDDSFQEPGEADEPHRHDSDSESQSAKINLHHDPESETETDTAVFTRIVRLALLGSHTALLELISRKLLTRILWFNYTPDAALLRFLERNAHAHKAIKTLLGVAYYRLLVDLPQVDRAECDYIHSPIIMEDPTHHSTSWQTSSTHSHSHSSRSKRSHSHTRTHTSAGPSPSHANPTSHSANLLKQPLFPGPAHIPLERRMKFLAAHDALTKFWEDLCKTPPEVPWSWQWQGQGQNQKSSSRARSGSRSSTKDSKLRKRSTERSGSRSTVTLRSMSSISSMNLLSSSMFSKRHSPHLECQETWGRLWRVACLEAQEVRRRGVGTRVNPKGGSASTSNPIRSTQNQSTADVLGLLKCVMLRLRRLTAAEEGICLDCSLAGLEKVDAMRDEVIEGLVELFRYDT